MCVSLLSLCVCGHVRVCVFWGDIHVGVRVGEECLCKQILFSSQFFVDCKRQEDKFVALCTLYGVVSIGQAMIFCHVSYRIA